MKESLNDFNKVIDDNTVLSYLLRNQEELQNQKKEVEEKLKAINKIIEEKNISVNQVSATIDPNINFFSPKDMEDTSRNVKIHNDINLLIIESEKYHRKFDELNIRLSRLGDIINWCKEKCSRSKIDDIIDNMSFSELFNSDTYRLNLLQTQEIERNRIARDLHDTTVQNLTNIVHKTELCTKLVDIDTVRAKLELQTMVSTIRTTIKDMRAIIYNLMPMSLEDLGLEISIEQLANQIMINNNIKVKLNIKNSNIKVPSIVNLTLFRIIQESCNNTLKHAKAKEIRITLNYSDSNIDLIVVDNGVGFDINESIANGNNISSSFGLSIMRERVYLLSGQIKIESKKDVGTKISVKVPINNYMEENNDTD